MSFCKHGYSLSYPCPRCRSEGKTKTCKHKFGTRLDDGTMRIEVNVRGDGQRFAECTKCKQWVPIDKERR